MTDYDKLEQLNRLRETGALTIDEFEQEKVKLLSQGVDGKLPPKRLRNVLIVGGAIFIAAVVLVASGFFKGTEQPEPASASMPLAPTNLESSPTSAKEYEGPNADDRAVMSLDWAFSPDVLGLNPVFVESKLGPAKTKSKSMWTFDVQGCDVTYVVSANEITSATSPVNDKCHPKVDSRKLTAQTTFAELGVETADIRASCLSMCGNAYDPTIDFYKAGYRANNYIEVLYRSAYGDAQYAASEIWRKDIRIAHGFGPEGSESDDAEWFTCVTSPSKAVAAALGPEHISSVVIGFNIGDNGNCKSTN